MKIKRDRFCDFIYCPYTYLVKKHPSAEEYASCLKFPACKIIEKRWFEKSGWITKDETDGFMLFLYKKEFGIKL